MKRKIMPFLLLIILLSLASCTPSPVPYIAQADPDFGRNISQAQAQGQEPALQEDGENDEISYENMHTALAAGTANGHLRISMSMPATLNPLLNSDPHVAQVLRLIFEPLVILDQNLRPIPNPAITQSIIFAPDGRSLSVSLRENIYWEDGSAITSGDIAFSIDVLRFSAPETAVYRKNVSNIASHSIIDSGSIQINLVSPVWSMKYMLNFPIIPANYYRPVSMTNLMAGRNMHPLGNGPFRFHSYELANHLELIANENAPGGVPGINRITAVILRDIETSVHAFEQGVIDILVSNLGNSGRYAAMGKNRAAELPAGSFDFIGFNFNRSIFAYREIRAAIAHSLDLNAILQRYYTLRDAAIAPINPSSWLAAADLESYSFDIQRAVDLFNYVGFVPGPDGILQRQLSEVLPVVQLSMTILVNEANAPGLSTAHILSQGLTASGVDSSVEALPFEQFKARIQASDFDIMIGGFDLSPVPDFDFLHSENIGSANIFGYSSEELDLLLSMLNNAPSESAFYNSAIAVQHYIAENLPFLGIGFHRQVLYTAQHISGNIQVSYGHIFLNVQEWLVH